MEDINNYKQNQEQFQSVKPTIKISLLILSSFIANIFIWFFLGLWIGTFMIAFLGGIGFLLIPVLFIASIFVLVFLQKSSLEKTEYKFYKNRIEYYEGFLVKNRKTINYDRITNIGQRKGIIEGMFGLGSIFIDTAGSSRKGHELSIRYLENPDHVYDWITKVTASK